jgi:hypothetical protein
MSEGPTSDETLPRRDWLLLPLVVILVASALFGISEVVANAMFAEQGKYTCGNGSPPPFQKANCVAYFKNAEGPMVEYRFNECGNRSTKPCGAKPPDTVRVVLIGTSITFGLYVPTAETFAARIEVALNQMCVRPVEVQNMGSLTELSSQPELAREALALSPDVIVLTVVPFDVETLSVPMEQTGPSAEPAAGGIRPLWQRLSLRIRDIKAVYAAAHFMLLDKDALYRTYLNAGGSRGVMTVPPPPSSVRKYEAFAAVLDRIQATLKGSGVPLLVQAVPNRVAAAMLSNNSRLQGTDAGWFGRHIGEIAIEHGALSLDVTPDFASVPHAEDLFYPVDNHPTGAANATIARALASRLTDGSIPQLAGCRAAQEGR